MAEVAVAGVGGAFGEDRHHRAVDVAVHHRDHITLDAITISRIFAAHDHFHTNRIGVAGGEGVVAMGLLKTAAHPVDRHLPELGGHGLMDGLVADSFHERLEVCAHLEASLHPLAVLLPDALAAVAPKARLPGVAVFVGRTKGGPQVAAGGMVAGNS